VHECAFLGVSIAEQLRTENTIGNAQVHKRQFGPDMYVAYVIHRYRVPFDLCPVQFGGIPQPVNPLRENRVSPIIRTDLCQATIFPAEAHRQ